MTSSTSSSPLFEQPFSEMQFHSNGDMGRLRRRENDPFSTPREPGTQPLFASPPPYYSHSTRRRSSGNSNSINRWVPRLFKAIIWSPLIVVVMWSSSALLYTRKAARTSVQVRPTSRAASKHSSQKQQHSESIKEGFITGVEVLESALGKEQPSHGMVPIIAPLGQTNGKNRQAPFSNFMHGIGNMVQGKPRQQVIVQPANLRPPMGSTGGAQGGVYQQPAMQYDGIYQPPNYEGTYQQQQQQLSNGYEQQPPMQYDGIYQQPNYVDGSYAQKAPPMQYDGIYQQPNYVQPNQEQQQPVMQYEGFYQQQPAMQHEGIYQQPNQEAYQKPPMQATGKSNHLRGSTQYLYYNPRDVVVVDGQVYLPPQAYDKNGKPHDLTHTRAQVFIQPPPLYGVHHFNHSNVTDSNYTYVHPNTVKTPVFGHHSGDSGDKEDSNAKGIAMPNLPPVEGNSSSILVATVGVVALLVGALSARHARGRACLNACLENETLASEAAYDTAHTRANTYSTFWKGDLEKFDV